MHPCARTRICRCGDRERCRSTNRVARRQCLASARLAQLTGCSWSVTTSGGRVVRARGQARNKRAQKQLASSVVVLVVLLVVWPACWLCGSSTGLSTSRRHTHTYTWSRHSSSVRSGFDCRAAFVGVRLSSAVVVVVGRAIDVMSVSGPTQSRLPEFEELRIQQQLRNSARRGRPGGPSRDSSRRVIPTRPILVQIRARRPGSQRSRPQSSTFESHSGMTPSLKLAQGCGAAGDQIGPVVDGILNGQIVGLETTTRRRSIKCD